MTAINAARTMINSYYLYYDGIKAVYRLHFEKHYIQPSYVNNYKDALMHFAKMYKNKNDETVLNEQLVLISEHLSRGLIDVHIELLQKVSNDIAAGLKDAFYLLKERNRCIIPKDNILRVLSLVHRMKEFILTLRTLKLEIFRFYKNSDDIEFNAFDLFAEIYMFLTENTECVIREILPNYRESSSNQLPENADGF